MSRTIVVTGGSSGIGFETVKVFQEHGDRVVVLDRTEHPDGVPTVRVDLADPASIESAAEQLPTAIDVLCNVAGIAGTAPSATVMSVNFIAPRLLVERLADRITPGGAVVSVASTAGWRWRDRFDDVVKLLQTDNAADAVSAIGLEPADGYEAYNRSKAALIVWTVLAARRFAGRFRLNTVSPGLVNTPLLEEFYQSMGADELDPLVAVSGRAARPAEIAAVIDYLASPAAHWINGSDIVADFGAEAYLALLEAAPQLVEQITPATKSDNGKEDK